MCTESGAVVMDNISVQASVVVVSVSLQAYGYDTSFYLFQNFMIVSATTIASSPSTVALSSVAATVVKRSSIAPFCFLHSNSSRICHIIWPESMRTTLDESHPSFCIWSSFDHEMRVVTMMRVFHTKV